MDHATRHSVITSSLTVLEALQRTLQELLGSIRWYGTMPIGYLVVWIIALHDDREETTANEELIQEGGKERKKMEEKRKQTKERAQKKGTRFHYPQFRPDFGFGPNKSVNTCE